jgi:LysR family positive regulator for ilvC
MDTRELAIFLSVADTLSFSRSSEAMHLSVSAVSRTVRRLEAELGQTLLERDRRRVRLTPAGREVRDYARRATADWQQLRRRLSADSELAGEVSVYCSVTASHSVLAPILSAVRRQYPAVDIMLHTGDQADGIGRVLSGQDDVAVTGRPDHLPERLAFLPLLNSPLVFCMPTARCAVRDLMLAGDTRSPGFDWSAVPLIIPERGITKEVLGEWLGRRGIRPRIYAQVAGHEAIVAMVGLGLGVGLAPELVIEAGGMGSQVTPVPLSDGLPPLRVGLCVARQRLENPLVRSFWDLAGQTYPEAV